MSSKHKKKKPTEDEVSESEFEPEDDDLDDDDSVKELASGDDGSPPAKAYTLPSLPRPKGLRFIYDCPMIEKCVEKKKKGEDC